MAIVIDPTVPPNTETPRNGATRIRNLAAGLVSLLNLSTGTPQTIGGPFIQSLDASGIPTFPANSKVASDPTTPTGLATKQYVDAKDPYALTVGGDAYTATVSNVNGLVSGQSVILKFNAANTTTSPTLNLSSLGVAQIKMADGSSPAIGSIAINGTYELVFDASSSTWVMASFLNPPTSPFPLTADVSAGGHKITNLANAAVTGDALNLGQFTGLNAASGFMTVPLLISGLLVKLTVNWGASAPATVNANSNSGAIAQSFAFNFATACYVVVASATNVGGAGASGCTVSVDNSSITASGFNLWVANQTNTNRSMGAQWVAVGQ